MSAHPMRGRRTGRRDRIRERPELWTPYDAGEIPWLSCDTDADEPYLVWVLDEHKTDPVHGWALHLPEDAWADGREAERRETHRFSRSAWTDWVAGYLTARRLPRPPQDDNGWVEHPKGTRIDVMPR